MHVSTDGNEASCAKRAPPARPPWTSPAAAKAPRIQPMRYTPPRRPSTAPIHPTRPRRRCSSRRTQRPTSPKTPQFSAGVRTFEKVAKPPMGLKSPENSPWPMAVRVCVCILSEFRAKHHFFRDTWFQRPSILNQGILKKAVWEIAALSFLKEMAWKWAGNGPRNLMLRQRSEEGWRNRFNQQLFARREVPSLKRVPNFRKRRYVSVCVFAF